MCGIAIEEMALSHGTIWNELGMCLICSKSISLKSQQMS
jgi:hypothetical protein